MIPIGRKEGKQVLTKEFTFDSYKITAEAGNFEAHEPLGWQRSVNRIDLAVYKGTPVFDNNGGSNGSDGSDVVPKSNANFLIPLVLEDFNNLHRYGGMYGGIVALDETNGELGCFTGFSTLLGDQITALDGTKPFTVNSKRVSAFIRHNGTNVFILEYGGTKGVVFNGTDTVDVIDWKGDVVTNTVPEIKPGEFLKFTFHFRDGLDKRIFLYVNDILVGNPTFDHLGRSNDVSVAAGSSSWERHTYWKDFGATINTNSNNMVLEADEVQASSALNITIPEGTRNYSIELARGVGLDVGYSFDIKSQTTRTLSWSPSAGTGLAATIESYSTGQITFDGLTQLIKTNILKDGSQFVASTDPNKLLAGSAELEYSNITHYAIYGTGQTGLDDLTTSGIYDVQDENTLFQIRIDSIGSGIPDTFEWKDYADGLWHTGIPITGEAQLLQNGITITFEAATGHTLADNWYFDAGHEIHVNRTMHVMGDVISHRDVIIAGLLQTFSPVRIMDGIEILCDKNTDRGIVNTTCEGIDFKIDGETVLPIECYQLKRV